MKDIDGPVRWELSGGAAQKANITKVLNTDSMPAINNSIIDVVFDKPYFNVSDVIQPEHNEYRFRVVHRSDNSKGYRYLGPNQYQYSIQMTTNSPDRYIPRKYIELDAKWNKVSSMVANEDNQDYGGFQFYSIFQSEGLVQQHATKFEVSDKVARKAKILADQGKYNDPDLGKYQNAIKHLWVQANPGVEGKPIVGFMSVLESEMFNRLFMDVENTLTLGQESSILYSPENHQMYSASGLREQLKSGWNLEHNGNLTLSELEDWLDMILKDKISEGQQKVVFASGREFRRMFDRMIKADMSSFMTLDTHFIRKGDDYRHMDYGSYFALYRGFTIDVTVMEMSAYDNIYFCPQTHPLRVNVPIDSWRGDVLDFGSSKQSSTMGQTDNISLVAEDYMDYHFTTIGKYHGMYDAKSGLPITDGGHGIAGNVSGFSVHAEKSAGLMITDITRCGSCYLCVDENDYSAGVPSAAAWWNY